MQSQFLHSSGGLGVAFMLKGGPIRISLGISNQDPSTKIHFEILFIYVIYKPEWEQKSTTKLKIIAKLS